MGLVDLGTNAHGISFAVNSDVAAALIDAWQAAPQPVSATVCDSGEEPPGTGSPTPAEGTPASGGGAEVYDGDQFSIGYPAGWVVDSAEAAKSYGTDTTIVDSDDGDRLIRVDVSPHAAGSPMSQARPVIDSLRRDSSYTELGLNAIDFQGHDAVRWEFTIEEDGRLVHKEDLFFTDDSGRGVAILTQAPSHEYEDWRELFDAVRNSFVSS